MSDTGRSDIPISRYGLLRHTLTREARPRATAKSRFDSLQRRILRPHPYKRGTRVAEAVASAMRQAQIDEARAARDARAAARTAEGRKLRRPRTSHRKRRNTGRIRTRRHRRSH